MGNILILNKDIKTLLENCYKYHTLYPFDPLHDGEHHRKVVKNILFLLEKEGLTNKVNINPLLIAASLHDAVDEKRGVPILGQLDNLQKYLQKIKAPVNISNQAIGILGNHSYGKKQNNFEQKILYDADKIEYSSRKRVDIGVLAVKKGKMSEERFRYYFGLWASRVPKVGKTLHFKQSKEMFVKNSTDFYYYVKSKYPKYFPIIEKVKNQVKFLK
jgi:hypothetical protein